MADERASQIGSTSSRCPACDTHGVPYAVELSTVQRTISYHCPACGEVWKVTDLSDAPMPAPLGRSA
jgi:predicted RNA-binding Zn-ribbon protein involved in translation (DUF1610 family)